MPTSRANTAIVGGTRRAREIMRDDGTNGPGWWCVACPMKARPPPDHLQSTFALDDKAVEIVWQDCCTCELVRAPRESQGQKMEGVVRRVSRLILSSDNLLATRAEGWLLDAAVQLEVSNVPQAVALFGRLILVPRNAAATGRGGRGRGLVAKLERADHLRGS